MGTLQKEPLPEIAESYHKARKAYGLASALLILWELVGIELGESPISNVDFTLQSPDAVPFILIALVFYFAFRFSIEYYHHDSRRRVTKPLKFDFYTAHGIGGISILIFFIQRLYDFQIFKVLEVPARSSTEAINLMTGIMSGALLGVIIASIITLMNTSILPSNTRLNKKVKTLLFLSSILVLALVVSKFFQVSEKVEYFKFFSIGFLIPIIAVICILLFIKYNWLDKIFSTKSSE